MVDIYLPSSTGPATYALPSAAVGINATFYITGPPYHVSRTMDSTLRVTSGTLTVENRDASTVTASFDIQLDTSAMEHLGAVGRIAVGNCKLVTYTACFD
jgi:hypothetical protein